MKNKRLIGTLAILLFLTPSLKISAIEDSKNTNPELYWGQKMMEEKLQEGLTHNFQGLFLNGEGMLPGDSVERSMKLKNTYKYPYTISLTGNRNPEDIDKEYDLLDKINLDLTIIKEDKTEEKVYSGFIFDGNKVKVDLKLCTLNPGEEVTLNALATLDGQSTTNEYMGRKAAVEWIFRVDGDDTKINPEGPVNPENPEDPVNPENPINPENPDKQNDLNTKNDENYTPFRLSNNDSSYYGGLSWSSLGKGLVSTGDSANILIILVLAGSSLLIGTLLFKKTNKEE
ncbi:hypothetical protein [uncultured Clostridium sp.]|uniref:hypothetical protein n=1 Tax=uncultured Clostridium sp. TaxID=59620 RepID=UPI0025CC22B8|nr:hypothetical protein [uncultured Clostridium sp.]